MPWHLSRSDPRKVYDERHEAVCVCQTAEQAALIVEAVRALPARNIEVPLPGPIALHTSKPDLAELSAKAHGSDGAHDAGFAVATPRR